MLCWILIIGGLLIMMGQHDRSEALFYYFRLDDQVPETHLLRLIDKHISFAFVRETLKQSYSETGRPSVDPELLLRIPVVCFTPPLSRNCRDCSTPPFSVVVTMGGNAITAVISHWKPPTPSGQRAL
jgi:catechol 2,3-dioxygenase-like lactoylglutathione lyase family enzyme